MNGQIGAMGGPIMPTVRYFQIMYIYSLKISLIITNQRHNKLMEFHIVITLHFYESN
jgi:hypothetical protein